MATRVLLALMVALVVGCCAADSCANTNSLETELVRLAHTNELLDFDETEESMLEVEVYAHGNGSQRHSEGGGEDPVSATAWGDGSVGCTNCGRIGKYQCIRASGETFGNVTFSLSPPAHAKVTHFTVRVSGGMCSMGSVSLTLSGVTASTLCSNTSVACQCGTCNTCEVRSPTYSNGIPGWDWGSNLIKPYFSGTAFCADHLIIDIFYTVTTPPPTGHPTSSPSEAEATGDPHITNLIGRSFDVKQPGEYTLARVPKEGAAVLKVDSLIESIGNACSMFITEVTITGALLSGDAIRVRASRQNSYNNHHQEPAPFSLQLSPGTPWIPLSSFPEGDEVRMKGYSMGNTSVEIKAKRDMVTSGSGNHGDDSGVNGFFIVNIIVPKQPLHTQIKLSKRRAWLNVHMARLAKLGYSEVGGILGTTEPDEKWSEPTPACERHMAGADRPEHLNLLRIDGAIHEAGQMASATD